VHPRREADVDAWLWVPIGLVAWFVVAIAVALWLGRVLGRWSQAREALDLKSREEAARLGEPPDVSSGPPS
jgi:hypothetical protein